jgi:arsenite oxidase small subunit
VGERHTARLTATRGAGLSSSTMVAPLLARKHVLRLGLSALAAGLIAPWRRLRAAGSLRVPAPKNAWDKAEFSYPGAARELPGIAVRLPQDAGGGVCAVCRICPHEGCMFGYETDYETVGGIIGKDLNHPVFFCRCHFSTFDPAGDGSVLYGPSQRPPWRFELREDGGDLLVTGVEPGAGEIG